MDKWESYRGWKISGEEITPLQWRVKAEEPENRVKGVGFISSNVELVEKMREMKLEIDRWIVRLEQRT